MFLDSFSKVVGADFLLRQHRCCRRHAGAAALSLTQYRCRSIVVATITLESQCGCSITVDVATRSLSHYCSRSTVAVAACVVVAALCPTAPELFSQHRCCRSIAAVAASLMSQFCCYCIVAVAALLLERQRFRSITTAPALLLFGPNAGNASASTDPRPPLRPRGGLSAFPLSLPTGRLRNICYIGLRSILTLDYSGWGE